MKQTLEQAAQLARRNRLREAEDLLAGILRQAPDEPRALHLLASIAEHRGDVARAAQILTGAAQANPDEFVLHAHLSALLRRLGRFDESIASGERAAALRPDDPVIRNDLAIAYSERGDYALAETHLKQALALKPDFAEPHNALGLIAVETGRFAEAVSHFETCLSLKPDAVFAYVNLLDAYTVREADDPHLREIERRLAGPLADADRMLLLFAAAKAYGDLDRRGDALRAAIEACALKRRSVSYDEAATMTYFDDVRRIVTPALMQRLQNRGVRSAKPIFVISMPRAGSTLVEQILASHPLVAGAGELPDFGDAVAEACGGMAGFLAAPDATALSRLGESYLQRITRRAPDAARIVDKMPSNFLVAGLIHLALPDAKIIHVQRNPVDTCVSCFTKHFTGPLPHTYDLAELGRYYRAYHGLMEHWRGVLPEGVMLDVRYESLVENLESEARRVLAHCGLPWDDAVLTFHRNTRPVKTHSLAQVRRPLYRSAIGRWRGHEAMLQPLLNALGDLAA